MINIPILEIWFSGPGEEKVGKKCIISPNQSKMKTFKKKKKFYFGKNGQESGLNNHFNIDCYDYNPRQFEITFNHGNFI